MRFAAIALAEATRSFDKLYDYTLSESDSVKAAPGMRVLVPFGRSNKLQSAWIIKVWDGEKNEKYKEVYQLVDDEPLLPPDLIKLAEWMKTRYFCTWGDVLRVMLPAGANLMRKRLLMARSGMDLQGLNQQEQEIFHKLLEKPEGISEQELIADDDGQKLLQGLIQKGYIEIDESFSQRITEKTIKAVVPAIDKDEFFALVEEGKVRSIHTIRAMEALFAEELCSLQDLLLIQGVTHSTIRSMAKKGWVTYCEIEVERDPFSQWDTERDEPPVLTQEQQGVLDDALPLLKLKKLNELLLFGITGSGKTEIYLRLIEETLKSGRKAIVLVPEISLTPQMTRRFTGRFGGRVAIQHSRLSQGERYDQWRKIRQGEVDVVIGARSAVFAPFKDIGVIIIDEEHELTYKSENTPKYDARQVARARCNMHGALLVMGSATPSVETFHRAKQGKIHFKTMKHRPNTLPLPQVTLVDMREELKEGNRSVLSRKLEEELVKAKEAGDQSILFLNRRGYASFLLCRDCGFVVKCPYCSVSLTVHKHDRQAICHYCGYTQRIPDHCPTCNSLNIREFGSGTQRVEEELLSHPARFSVLRMDLDTTGGKHGHQKLLNAFRNREADILIGTQMVAKGHDFPHVTCVGILSADASLFNSDYRSSERTFQLITQASGRAGRGQKSGRVIVQAYNVDDYAVRAALSQDYEAFFDKEIVMRKQLLAPPFCHIGLIVVSGENVHDARESLERIKTHILSGYTGNGGFQCSDILPSPVFIVRNRARWRVIIKMASINQLVGLMNQVVDSFAKLRIPGTDVSVDIDPSGMV
jgi:primosomal protein N' (replication factor Y)